MIYSHSNPNIEIPKHLKEIAHISDDNFNIPPIHHNKRPITRLGSRGIVLNDNDEIAVIHKKLKMNINFLAAVLTMERIHEKHLGVNVEKSWVTLSS